MPRKTDKRTRLIEAAQFLIHKQGFNLTTLADIAQAASVPLGNVYYYFKTKAAIGVAVIEKLAEEQAALLTKLNDLPEAAAKLREFVNATVVDMDAIARYGCPIGGLCQELSRQGGDLADQAAKLMRDNLKWVEEQFRILGFTEKAAEYALSLVSSIQGMHLLTHTFKDLQLAQRQTNTVMAWLDKILSQRVTIVNKVREVEAETVY